MTKKDVLPVLSIGAVVGGARQEARAWKDEVNRLGRRVRDAREGVSSPIRLNVVFQIPGEVADVDFEGVRTARYSETDRHLLVQAALPPTFTDDPQAYLVELLRQAVDEAERYALRRKLSADLNDLHALVDSL